MIPFSLEFLPGCFSAAMSTTLTHPHFINARVAASPAARMHEAESRAFISSSIYCMLVGKLWECAKNAAYYLWQASSKFKGNFSKELEFHSTLLQKYAAAVETEDWMSGLGDVPLLHDAYLALRDVIAWQVILRLDENRNIDSAAQPVCPSLFADVNRRANLLNSIHKKLNQLSYMGQYLQTYAVPSGNRSKRRGKKSKQDPGASHAVAQATPWCKPRRGASHVHG